MTLDRVADLSDAEREELRVLSAAVYPPVEVTEASHDGRPVRVGGIGGVKTHPAARRRGLAERGEPRLLAYYGRLGWREFTGELLVRQRGATAPFTFNRVMTCGVLAPAPAGGTIDLQGPAW